MLTKFHAFALSEKVVWFISSYLMGWTYRGQWHLYNPTKGTYITNGRPPILKLSFDTEFSSIFSKNCKNCSVIFLLVLRTVWSTNPKRQYEYNYPIPVLYFFIWYSLPGITNLLHYSWMPYWSKQFSRIAPSHFPSITERLPSKHVVHEKAVHRWTSSARALYNRLAHPRLCRRAHQA